MYIYIYTLYIYIYMGSPLAILLNASSITTNRTLQLNSSLCACTPPLLC